MISDKSRDVFDELMKRKLPETLCHEIAYKYMNDPKKIAVNHGSLTVERIDQKYILCVNHKCI